MFQTYFSRSKNVVKDIEEIQPWTESWHMYVMKRATKKISIVSIEMVENEN